MKNIKYILILLVFATLISSSEKHEYYVSVTTVEYAKKQKSIQIISQIFINDFEKLLRQRYDESITLDIPNEDKMVDDYMSRYLEDKIKLMINGKPVNFTFIGKEYKDDITYCYLEVEKVRKIKSIEVTNKVLFDVFSEQQNIVRIKMLGKNKSFLLLPDKDKCVLNFD
ncbi:DUF6702 family protein [Winogradskyella sp.]|uniref:DUF6702 family protein n=1 Tax=Winogradskyella sp. TaxID=1883156 RepID=UPI003F6C4FEC